MRLPRPASAAPRSCASFFLAVRHAHGWAEFSGRGLHALAIIVLPAVLPAMFLLRSTREEIYNILWALVFGFATLNILSLGARRFEAGKTGLNFGEILAILVVLGSVILLAWGVLDVVGIFAVCL